MFSLVMVELQMDEAVLLTLYVELEVLALFLDPREQVQVMVAMAVPHRRGATSLLSSRETKTQASPLAEWVERQM